MKKGLFMLLSIFLIITGMTLIVMGYAPKELLDIDDDGIPDAQDDYVEPPAPTNDTGNGGYVEDGEPYVPPWEPPPEEPPDDDPEHPPDYPEEPPPEEPPDDYIPPPFIPSVKLPDFDLSDIGGNMQIIGFVLVCVGLLFMAFPARWG